ncbi:MAG: hypothetical protein DIJKHBIC_04628 [Thermoanaerobaculia bacterium]|nr:hypothetical protein [Thermoanaerobaculia bacterium]
MNRFPNRLAANPLPLSAALRSHDSALVGTSFKEMEDAESLQSRREDLGRSGLEEADRLTQVQPDAFAVLVTNPEPELRWGIGCGCLLHQVHDLRISRHRRPSRRNRLDLSEPR